MLIPISIIALVLGLSHAAPTSTASSLEVDLGYTKYEGHKLSDGINQWLGMRYAARPLKELRFKAPQEPPKSDKKVADKHGALCHFSPSTKIDPTHSEDCLFIDVAAPAEKGPHPVYFFIQGGGFNTLSNPNRDPQALMKGADNKIVVVSFNYRVGPWGFLASKEVQKDGNLNVGLLDQRMAMKWVQKHIHLFGGDPKHVTIDGNSAGAASVDLHLTAYGGKDDGLFHAAIGQSNSYGAQLTVQESQYQYDGLVGRTGCGKAKDTLKCLRELDVKVIAQHNIDMPTPGATGNPVFMYSNVIEGPGGFTQGYTYDMFASGKFIKVPTIFGSVTNEGTNYASRTIKTQKDINDFLHNNWSKLTKEHLEKIEALYKAENNPQDTLIAMVKDIIDAELHNIKKNFDPYWATAAQAYGEMRYNCPGIFMNNMIDKYGKGDANWHYQWDVVNPNNIANGQGVTHIAELAAIWGGGTAAEKPLSPIIQSYWTSFVRSKDPNTHRAPGSPEWKTWGRAQSRIHFPNDPKRVGMRVLGTDLERRCTYLSSIGKTIGM